MAVFNKTQPRFEPKSATISDEYLVTLLEIAGELGTAYDYAEKLCREAKVEVFTNWRGLRAVRPSDAHRVIVAWKDYSNRDREADLERRNKALREQRRAHLTVALEQAQRDVQLHRRHGVLGGRGRGRERDRR